MRGNSFLASMIYDALNRNATRKKLKQIARTNLENQGIVEYQPSQIEAFFDVSDSPGNTLISGGSDDVRHRATARAIECAYLKGFYPVIIHCGGNTLEHVLAGYFGSRIFFVNKSNPIYDPFLGLSNAEISQLTIQSAMKGHEIQGYGRYYLNGISDFIRAKGLSPYIRMYITCPHLALIDKVNDAEAQGVIPASIAKQIISEISQGERERGNIEGLFSSLDIQASVILATKKNLVKAINVRTVASAGGIFSMDVISSTNKLLMNFLAGEIESLLSDGKKVFLCMVGVQVAPDDRIGELIAKSGTDCAVLISSEDVYASFGGNDNLFFSTAGKAQKIIVSKHSSSYSCQKWSEIIGSYDKQEISGSVSNSFNVFGIFGATSTQSMNINIKREQVVKPEEISRMQSREVYIFSKSNGELSHTSII